MKLFKFFSDKSEKSKDFEGQDNLKRQGVLIVDDSRFSRNILRDILESEAFEVVGEASNGQEAITNAEELRPEIIFLDVEMPIIDGLEALPKIIDNDPGVYVVMCTALGQKKIMTEATRSGAKGYVIKPYKKENITDVLSQYKSSMIEVEEFEELGEEPEVTTQEETTESLINIPVGFYDSLENEGETLDSLDYTENISGQAPSKEIKSIDSLASYEDIKKYQYRYKDAYDSFTGVSTGEEESELAEDSGLLEEDFNLSDDSQLEENSENTIILDKKEEVDNSSTRLMYLGMMSAYTARNNDYKILNKRAPSLKLSINSSTDRSFVKDILDTNLQTNDISMEDSISNLDILEFIVSPDDKEDISTGLDES